MEILDYWRERETKASKQLDFQQDGDLQLLTKGETPMVGIDGSGAAPKVFIVLLNWNGWRDTLQCVQSLRYLTYPNYSVVIVDNGSVGDDVELLRREVGDSCYLIENAKNEGFSAGNNAGIRHALGEGADYVFILNNDTVMHPSCLSRMVEVGQAQDSVGIISPKIYAYGRAVRAVYPRQVDRWPLALQFHLAHTGLFNRWVVQRREATCAVQFVDGCSALVKREVLQQVGLYEPAHFLGGYESFDLSQRVLKGGFRMVAVLDAVVWAKKGGSSFGDQRRGGLAWAYWGPRDRVLFARRKLPPLHYAVFLLALPLYLMVWTAAFGRRAKSLRVLPTILRGLRDGFKLELPHSANAPFDLEGRR